MKTPALAPPAAQPRNVSKPPQHEAQAQPQQELLLNQAAQASPPQSSAANDLLALNAMFTSGAQTSIPRSSTFPMAVQKPGELWAPQASPWGEQNVSTGILFTVFACN